MHCNHTPFEWWRGPNLVFQPQPYADGSRVEPHGQSPNKQPDQTKGGSLRTQSCTTRLSLTVYLLATRLLTLRPSEGIVSNPLHGSSLHNPRHKSPKGSWERHGHPACTQGGLGGNQIESCAIDHRKHQVSSNRHAIKSLKHGVCQPN